MKLKINVCGGLLALICMLVTLASITGFSLMENMPPLYQWSFYVIAIWYIWIMYRTLGTKTHLHSKMIRNICVLSIILLSTLIWLVSAQNGMPLQLFTFLSCVLFLQISMQYQFSETDINVVLGIGVIGATFFSWAFATKADVAYWYDTALTFEGFNPQSVGCWACTYGMLVILAIGRLRIRRVVKVMLAALCGYLFYITIATDTRAALVVLLVFIILKCMPQIKVLEQSWLSIIVAALPMLVSITSIVLYNNNFFTTSVGGSLLDGREILWMEYLALTAEHPFLGDYAHMQGTYTHNLFVEHVLLFGYILAILFMVLTALALSKAVANIKERRQYDAYIAFAGMLLLSSQENMVFSTGCGGMFVYAYVFLFIISSNCSQAFPQRVNLHL